MQGFGKIIEFILTAVLLFLIPLQYSGAKMDTLSQTYVMTETAYLVESVRSTGHLTEQMYQSYLKRLSETQQLYEVELTHYERRLNETEDGYQPYYHGIYTEKILESLDKEKIYYFYPDDFFRVQIKRVSPTWEERVSLFWRGNKRKANTIEVIYGGRIRNEAY